MPPKTNDGELTLKEKAILGLAWKCFQSEPKIDWDKLASLGGYTNPRSAQNLLSVAKKKLNASIDATDAAEDNGNENGNDNDNGNVASPKTPRGKKLATTPRGKKRAAETEGDDGDVARTPKRAKKTPTKRTPKPVQHEDQDEDEIKEEINAEDNEAGDADANVDDAGDV
ncbi:hypothetical protein F5Y10DRAFT_266303 [Nemania abortiva]|nr:hypothetical protein F5Y10DRAFT_266303 [Nemania abortiva]